MSFVKVMIHAVLGTKSHYPFLTKVIKQEMIAHIKENAHKKQIFIEKLNGGSDHLHCLFGLNADLSIAKTLQLLKGESTRWINQEKMIQPKFEWADEYFAVSVSESVIDKVRAYIDNQEEHHKKETFMLEYEQFIRKYNFKSHG